MPDRIMPVRSGDVAGLNPVAVAQEDRRFRLSRLNPRRIDRQHIRAVEEIGDAAKAFRLALRRIDAVGPVKTHQRLVGRRVQRRDDLQHEGIGRRCEDRQPVGRHDAGVVCDICAVKGQARQRKPVALQNERRAGRRRVATRQAEPGGDGARLRHQPDIQIDVVDGVVGRPVFRQTDDRRIVGPHGACSFAAPHVEPFPAVEKRTVRRPCGRPRDESGSVQSRINPCRDSPIRSRLRESVKGCQRE